MKLRIALILGSILVSLWGCGGQAGGPLEANGFRLTGALSGNVGDSLNLYALDGFNFKKLSAVSFDKSGDSARISFRGTVPRPGFYWVGTSLQNVTNLPLGGEEVSLSGNGGRMDQVRIQSATMDRYGSVSQQFRKMETRLREQQNRLGTPNLDEAMKAGIAEQMQAGYQEMIAFVDSVEAENPIIGKSLRLDLAPPFIPGVSAAPTPAKHYASTFLKEVDLSDPDYAYSPLPDKVQEYTLNVAGRIQLDPEEATGYIQQLVDRLPAGSITQKNVLARVVYALEQAQHAAYPAMVNKYLAIAPNSPRAQVMRQNAQTIAAKARQEAEFNARFKPGQTPPEIALKNPNGKVVKLSDLKGKVVMIDFWASWCGPCRRENPNVVKLYNKYKSKGFEILGVSLDKDKQRWLQAIEQDGLDWLHVSDLKYWQCEAAKDYGVSGIPATFLVDREGKMIAKGLRGAALEQKLEEIFGA